MKLTTEKILQFIQNQTTHPMKTKELAQAMQVSRRDYEGFRRLVKKLISRGAPCSFEAGKGWAGRKA